MAKIKGFEIKNIVTYRGHEGEELRQGTIYYNGKKVGFYRDGDYGSGSDVDVPREIANLVKDYRLKDFTLITGIDAVMYDLLDLIDDEKAYKKLVKKGAQAVAFLPLLNGFQIRAIGFTYTLTNPLQEVMAYLGDTSVAVDKIRIYTSPKDFIRG